MSCGFCRGIIMMLNNHYLFRVSNGYCIPFNIVSGLVPINVIADSFLPMSLSECPQ